MPGQKLWQCPNTPMTRSNETSMVQVLSAWRPSSKTPTWRMKIEYCGIVLSAARESGQPGSSPLLAARGSVPSCFAREHVIPGLGMVQWNATQVTCSWHESITDRFRTWQRDYVFQLFEDKVGPILRSHFPVGLSAEAGDADSEDSWQLVWVRVWSVTTMLWWLRNVGWTRPLKSLECYNHALDGCGTWPLFALC